MLMTFAELRYRANMTADPVWEVRYTVALDHNLPDPVDLDEVNRLMGGPQGFASPRPPYMPIMPAVSKPEPAETWRDRAIKEPLL